MSVVDLFAGGARGWCYAARELGLDPLGIELDDAACRVSRAAGFPTLQGDVAALDPLDFAPCTGLVGGPPCPAFSMAGKSIGRAAIPFLADAITRMTHGEMIDGAELDAACEDATAHLVLEPLRWTLALRPRWVALEQVEPVLPLWEATAAALRLHGYRAWCGVVSAETFGTPQTRRRTILVASLDGPVCAPVATHQRYVAPRRQAEGEGLFALPEPERIVVPEDRDLLPWVSMAQALGWGMTCAPVTSVVTPRGGGCATSALDGGSDARRRYTDAKEAGAWEWITNTGTRATRRPVDEPAPTITGGASAVHDPSLAVTSRFDLCVWLRAVRVSIEEAAILQGFPPGHLWMAAGSKSAAYRCVGNAIPPQMALAALLAAGAGRRGT